jgi:hypothetical protein
VTPLKLTKDILLEPSETISERVGEWFRGPDSLQSAKLEPGRSVAEVWPKLPNSKQLHIMVELPSGERCVHWVSEISLIVFRFLTSMSPRCLADKCLHRSLRPIMRFLLYRLCSCASPRHLPCLCCLRSCSHTFSILCSDGTYVKPRSFLRRREVLDDNDQPSPKRPRLDSFWLRELHSKIWNREDLEPTLFREVKLTRAYYDALEDSLNQKYPDRDTEGYDGRNHIALREKLDILNGPTPAATPAETDNHEDLVGVDDDDEDDSVLNLCFPFTLRYLDLSTLQLKDTTDRFPLAFFVRQDYGYISKLISEGPRNSNGSVIISGQPGTGEVLVSLSRRI